MLGERRCGHLRCPAAARVVRGIIGGPGLVCLVWPWVASGVLGSGVGGWCRWVRALAPDTCSVGPEAVLSVVLCTSLFLFVVCLFQTKLLYDIFCMLQGRVVLSGCPWPRWADIC